MEEEKEEIFRKMWMEVFNIGHEENIHFDANNEDTVNNFITENQDYLTPYNHADLDSLDNTSYLTSKIMIQEVSNIIKKPKNSTPGTKQWK